ncbi:2-hydroxyacid dehydrogenase [Alistipes sp.]|mgnify:FL=1|uniref:2-hydroxyacid dehydrogenase n=1 Tax=Alistipes sp. TaxID=1872444 RepID=UPI003A83E45D
MKPIVAFFGTQPYEQESFDAQNRDFGFEFRYFKGHLNRQTAVATHGAQAACIFVNDTADAAVIGELARNGVQLLALRCAGYNNVDLEAAHARGIPVVRVPAYSPSATAEYTVALMLSLNRKIPRASWRTRDGNFSLQGLMGFDMNGKTAGVVGTGKIARIVIRILLGFGMQVLAYDLFPDDRFARQTGITYVPLDELYRRSDIITLHCPLTEATEHLIDEDSIARMKRGVMIVNTGRGGLIQTEALIEGLKSGQIGSAGLDVYEEESDYFYQDRSDTIIGDDTLARLLLFPNVIVTSHQAFFTAEAMHNITRTTLQNIRDFFDGRPLVNAVTK